MTWNTAPKLHNWTETLREIQEHGQFPCWLDLTDVSNALDAAIAALAPPSGEGVDGDRREFLGKLVRMEWVAWAREQPNAKPSWLLPWEQLTEPEREVDRRIGERIYQVAVIDATTPQSAPVDGAFERAMKASWEMVVTTPAWAAGSFIAGQNSGMVKALETVRDNYQREIARQPPTTPPPASQERGGEWKASDRVLWQSSNGTEFPGTIVRRNLVTYDCKLDDGCDADGFVAARFKPLPPSSPWKCDTIGCGQLNSSWATECGRCEMPRAASPPSSAADLTRHNPIALTPPERELREYANACRLAGGVTVDDAMVERAVAAYMDHGDYTITRDLIRAMLVAALGARNG